MVKETVWYKCEWPGCMVSYQTPEKAEECEQRGLIGPEIEPGLILRTSSDWSRKFPYLIVAEEEDLKGHNRKYSLLLTRKPRLLSSNRWMGIREKENVTAEIIREIYAKGPRLLSEREFEELSSLIEKDPNFSLVKQTLEERSITLYRSHPYFE